MADLAQEATVKHLQKTTNTIILDFLLWESAKTILEDEDEDDEEEEEDKTSATVPAAAAEDKTQSRGRRLVGLVDGLILTYEQRDGRETAEFTPHALLKRRLDLAALAIVFVYRDRSSAFITRRSLARAESQSRSAMDKDVRDFMRSRGICSVIERYSVDAASWARVMTRHMTPAIRQAAHRVLPPCRGVTMRDALHGFMRVSAASFRENGKTPSPKWIEIALQFALIATLEAYLVHDTPGGTRAIDACFMYGVSRAPKYGHPDLDVLFSTAASGEQHRRQQHRPFVLQWEDARDVMLHTLLDVPAQTSLPAHLLQLLLETDVSAFKRSVTRYLVAILEGMPRPDLCKYPPVLNASVLRAPGMISIQHDSAGHGQTTIERKAKRAKVSA